MQLVVILVTAVVFVAGVLVRFSEGRRKAASVSNPPVEEKVKGTNSTEESIIETPKLTEEPVTVVTPTPQALQKNQDANSVELAIFRYPGASILSSGSTHLALESGDNPEVITDWYKDTLTRFNYTTRSFVVTKTNDNVLNKLVAAGGAAEVTVEIARPAGQSLTEIKVSLE